MSSNEWIPYKLGEICTDIAYGYTASADWEIEGPKFLRITDIQDYFINWETVPQCSINISDRKKYLLEIGDIVIARTGASTGSTFTLKDKVEAVFASYLIRYKINNEVANPFYIGYLLKSSKWKEYVSSIIGGSAQPGANAKQFADFDFVLPSDVKVQNNIVNILSSIDEKIENNLETNKTLEEIARTIFKEWFINFNYPNADGGRKHSEFGEIPSDWEILGIGEVCYVQNGYAFKSNDFKEEGEVGIIKIKNINGNVVDIEKTDFVDANVVDRLDKKFKIESGSLLIAMTGAEVGKIGLVPLTEKNLWLNQRVGMFKEKIAYGNLFMYLLLSSDIYQTNIQNSALGSAQPNISASAIESIRAIIPTADLIEAFGKIVNPMFEKILDNLAENDTLKITRDSLLPKLMSGEIDVNISNA